MHSQCDWEAALERINDMLDDPDYEFAYETLESIANWVDENHHITPKQEEAVENIYQSIKR